MNETFRGQGHSVSRISRNSVTRAELDRCNISGDHHNMRIPNELFSTQETVISPFKIKSHQAQAYQVRLEDEGARDKG
jgi:hypothetical protein